jgi:hypothetical protein
MDSKIREQDGQSREKDDQIREKHDQIRRQNSESEQFKARLQEYGQQKSKEKLTEVPIAQVD